MFQKPSAAKRLYFDVIPRTVDDYLGFLDAYPRQEWRERLGNPVWHIHSGAPPAAETLEHGAEGQTTVSFAMLLNLAAVANSDNPAVLWGFLRRYAPSATPETHPRLDKLVHYAVAYFRDFVAPKKRYRAADAVERGALEAVSAKLAALPPRTRPRRRSSMRSTTSRGRSRATRTSTPRARRRSGRACRASSSPCSTRCCSARSADRASARSSRSTASKRRGR